MKIRQVEAELCHAQRWTDGWADRYDEARVAFRNFADMPKKNPKKQVYKMSTWFT
jgi:hypothetical protein